MDIDGGGGGGGSYDFPRADDEKQKCLDFLQRYVEGDWLKYMDRLQEIKNRERKVLDISLTDILDHRNDEDFVKNVSANTSRYLRHFEWAADTLLAGLTRTAEIIEDTYDIIQNQRNGQVQAALAADPTLNIPDSDREIPKALSRRYEVCIVPGPQEVSRKLREIKAADIGHLVKVKGMVTRSTDVKPRIAVATYTCEECGSEIFAEINTPDYMPITQCPSQRCQDNKKMGKVLLQTRGSKFIKYQELKLQELPDQVPTGHIPRSMTIHCRGEQTRQCGPGDIVVVSGIFMTVKNRGYKAIRTGLSAETYIEAMQVEKQKVGYGEMRETDNATREAVRRLAADPDPYSLIARSIAPEIFGHEDVKKALLLQLVGGVTKTLPDGMKIRGDVNICLMGDPGVAKSQLLKYIATVAPRGVYTTGKGSSGVGLTASVVKDTLTGELALEGGALVLADMGICCIDEFDKMDESDRTAIHEVMEQQTISIAKAGITTTLNARAAVLAAANPLYGRYNRRKSISENVDLPNSLLSRFDLLFLILDKADMELDLALSRHVLHVHRYLKNPDRATQPIEPAAMKQYIAAARTLEPAVPQELSNYIVEAYVQLRQQDTTGQPNIRNLKGNDQAIMTARQLLSILRLSQGLARLRMADLVTHEDVDEAIRLIHASKASLLDDGPTGPREDVVSAVYTVMRDYVAAHNTHTVSYAQVEAMVIKKGFTAAQLQTTLQEYSGLGVVHLDNESRYITFDGL